MIVILIKAYFNRAVKYSTFTGQATIPYRVASVIFLNISLTHTSQDVAADSTSVFISTSLALLPWLGPTIPAASN